MFLIYCSAISVSFSQVSPASTMPVMPVPYAPFTPPNTRAVENVRPVVVESEHEAAVDHDAEGVESARDVVVALAEVLLFVSGAEASLAKAFKADED